MMIAHETSGAFGIWHNSSTRARRATGISISRCETTHGTSSDAAAPLLMEARREVKGRRSCACAGLMRLSGKITHVGYGI